MKKLISRRQFLWIILPIAVAGLLWRWPDLISGAPANAPVFPRASLTIQRADGQKFSFAIEVATTPEQTSYGLMFRRSLPENAGMLFLFQPDQVINMWMKDTYIPLDMVFVRANGAVVKIVTHAEPFSLASISSDEPVRAVIELGDGIAAGNGIKIGDKVLYPAFAPAP